MPVLTVSGSLVERSKVQLHSGSGKKVTRKTIIITTQRYHMWRISKSYIVWRNNQRQLQRNKCFYCQCSLKNVMTNVEHVKPISLGGTNKYSNLVLSCKECNKAKGSNKPNPEWVKKARLLGKANNKLSNESRKRQ